MLGIGQTIAQAGAQVMLKLFWQQTGEWLR